MMVTSMAEASASIATREMGHLLQKESVRTCRIKKIESALKPAAAGLLVDAKEHGERHNKVNGVERRANGVSKVAVFKGVIGKVGDGESFHEGSDISQYEDNKC